MRAVDWHAITCNPVTKKEEYELWERVFVSGFASRDFLYVPSQISHSLNEMIHARGLNCPCFVYDKNVWG